MKLLKEIFFPACVLLAGILWGTSGLFVRNLEANGVSMAEICFLHMTTAMLMLVLVFAIIKPTAFKIKIKDAWIFICSGVISILGTSFTYFTAIELSSMSFACIMMYTAPIFVAIFSRVLFKEKNNALESSLLSGNFRWLRNVFVPRRWIFGRFRRDNGRISVWRNLRVV